MDAKTEKIIATRENPVYESREDQLKINLSGLKGGRPYVEMRLSRFSGESKADWDGTNRKDGSIVTGRKEQSHCIPYLGRIAEKINQYVLGVRPVRNGADLDILNDITSDGESINQFMRKVNSQITACRWCWIGLDMPRMTEGTLSAADKASLKIRPYWKLYTALDVADWKISDTGRIEWLITEEKIYQCSTPFEPASNNEVRRIWEPGKVTTIIFKGDSDKVMSTTEDALEVSPGKPLPAVPFVLCGEISDEPHQFDNLESINRTIMDLESANRQNFFKCVFPQAYIPTATLDNVKQQFEVNADKAVSMIMGMGYPILLNTGDPAPGYMMPDASAIGTMRTEIDALRMAMFVSVGLMLQQETRQVASAESKAWDFLDVTQVMRERAELLEDAERKAMNIMTLWDSSVPVWEPLYNRSFDAGNFETEIASIIQAMTAEQPDELRRVMLKKLYERVKLIGTGAIDEKTEKAILAAIDIFSPGAGFELMPSNPQTA